MENNDPYTGTDVKQIELVTDYTILKSEDGTVKPQFMNPAFSGKKGLVVFHQPWCPHCQNLAPTMIKVASMTKGLFPIGVINCSDTKSGNNLLADYFDITGYPTIKYYDNGNFTDYTGGRQMVDFLQFLCKEAGICDLSLADYMPNEFVTPERKYFNAI